MVTNKSTDARDLHVATLGPASLAYDRGLPERVSARTLIERYGRWVARCTQINAQAAAGVRPRLLTVDRSGAVRKHFPGARTIDRKLKAHLDGRNGVLPSSTARKAMQGNMDDMVELTDHPLLTLLDDVNPHTEGYRFREEMYGDLQWAGKSFTHMVGTDNGKPPRELWRMLPQLTKVVPDPAEFVRGFIYGSGRSEVKYEPHEVLWIREADPGDLWGGLGRVEAWLKTIDADFAVVAFQNWMLDRGGTPDTVLVSKNPVDEKQRNSFMNRWRRMFGRLSNRQENVALLDGDISVHKLGATAREMEFKDLREAGRDEIGQAFGVPKALLTSDDVNLANAREGSITHMRTTVWPMVVRVEERWNQVLVPLWSDRMCLVHDNPIPEERMIRIQERQSKLASGYSINELRIEDGVEPLEDPMADVAMMASGLQPLSGVGVAADGVGDADVTDEPTEDETPETGDTDAVDLPPGGDVVSEATVLNGAQINAATAIVQAVVDGLLPLESAAGQLRVMFNLDDDQVAAMLAGVDTFKPEKPAAPAPPVPPPPPADDDEDEDDDGAKSYDQTAVGVELQSEAWFNHQPDPNETAEQKAQRASSKFIDSMAAALDEFIEATVGNLDAGSKAKASDFIGPVDVLESAIESGAAPEIAAAFAKAGAESIAIGGSGLSFDLLTDRPQRYIRTASRRVGGEVSKTFSQTIRRTIRNGLDTGMSAAEIAREIRSKQPSLVKWKSEMIARTETAFAYTNGHIEGWKQSGVVSGMTFVCAPDCCDFCKAIEAQSKAAGETGLDGAFVKKGDSITLPSETPGGSARVMKFDYAPVVGRPVHPHCGCPGATPVLIEE